MPTPPIIPEDWDYDESVGRVRGFVYKAKNLTEEILDELWIARKILTENFNRWQKGGGANAPPPTWNQYCEDIGIHKTTANRWLTPKKPVHISQNTGFAPYNLVGQDAGRVEGMIGVKRD